MPEDIQITYNSDYLLVEVKGKYGLKKAKEIIDMMAKSCKVNECPNVLIDVRKLGGEISFEDKIEISEYSEITLAEYLKVAFLTTEKQVKPVKFFETIAGNRGITVKIFKNSIEALGWLNEVE